MHVLSEYEGQHLLLVAHVGIIRSILIWLMDASLRNANRINISPGGVSRIRVAYDENEYYPVIEYINR
jgi:broad specificity phosphatase PhoE